MNSRNIIEDPHEPMNIIHEITNPALERLQGLFGIRSLIPEDIGPSC